MLNGEANSLESRPGWRELQVIDDIYYRPADVNRLLLSIGNFCVGREEKTTFSVTGPGNLHHHHRVIFVHFPSSN